MHIPPIIKISFLLMLLISMLSIKVFARDWDEDNNNTGDHDDDHHHDNDEQINQGNNSSSVVVDSSKSLLATTTMPHIITSLSSTSLPGPAVSDGPVPSSSSMVTSQETLPTPYLYPLTSSNSSTSSSHQLPPMTVTMTSTRIVSGSSSINQVPTGASNSSPASTPSTDNPTDDAALSYGPAKSIITLVTGFFTLLQYL